MKINRTTFETRTVKAKLTFEEDGVRKTDEFTVHYKSLSPARLRKLNEMQADGDNTRAFAEALAEIITSIPEIVEGEEGAETPIQISADVLDNLFDWPNLNAINDAITADTFPKQQPLEG